MATKLQDVGERISVDADEAAAIVVHILERAGCAPDIAREVADHLADASLSGVESHGLMRVLQYAEQFAAGYMKADARPEVRTLPGGAVEIDGNGGIGIPVMNLAAVTAVDLARRDGIASFAVRNLGHTGRIGAYTERMAEAGCLAIVIGGGNREVWRQVAPFGGRQAKLPTNPYSIAVPGGDRGPVVLDFATGKIAGGWIYAAKSAGGRLPPDCIIDVDGNPSTNPDDYFGGGAILPAAGPKGFGMGLVAELIAEAMLGPATTEQNWLVIAQDAARFRPEAEMRAAAETILADIRDCRPTEGFERVEIPGERERDARAAANGRISIPRRTWAQILSVAEVGPGGGIRA